jgi:23S rRNA pseudouridine1911/1915/1917 synthase
MPKTGRTHQIRVHLAYIGHPVAGDALYNRPEAMGGAKSQITDHKSQKKSKTVNRQPSTVNRLDVPRLMLHAAKLTFVHYKKGEPIELEMAIPEDMSRVILKLKLEGLVRG